MDETLTEAESKSMYQRPRQSHLRRSTVNTTVSENIETITVLDSDQEEEEQRAASGHTGNDERRNQISEAINSSRFFSQTNSAFNLDNYLNNPQSYIMDAKTCGNIGRYFNHSCSPNMFVQNVFVDTYDLRFPWIAFFAFTSIKAGSELCWVCAVLIFFYNAAREI
jgi:ABC-type multidrug transport system fused ATPase/permease subunit